MTANPLPESNPLRHCNMDGANYLLREGRATEADALAYAEVWNSVPRFSGVAYVETQELYSRIARKPVPTPQIDIRPFKD
jgi:hypothetical protein